MKMHRDYIDLQPESD